MQIDSFPKVSHSNKDEMERRKPKPFRYVTDEWEVKDILEMETQKDFSVMKIPDDSNLSVNSGQITSLGNGKRIESIIKKHEVLRGVKVDENKDISIH